MISKLALRRSMVWDSSLLRPFIGHNVGVAQPIERRLSNAALVTA